MAKMENTFKWGSFKTNDYYTKTEIDTLLLNSKTWKNVELTKTDLEITWPKIDVANEMNLIINFNDGSTQLFAQINFISDGATNLYITPAVVNGGDVYNKYVLLTIYFDSNDNKFHLIASINNAAYGNFITAQARVMYR